MCICSFFRSWVRIVEAATIRVGCVQHIMVDRGSNAAGLWGLSN